MTLLPLVVCGLLPPAPLEVVHLAEERHAHHLELIRHLDDDSFAVREKATAELKALGRQALPAVLNALRRPDSPEVGKRLEGILGAIAAASRGNVVSGLRTSLAHSVLRVSEDDDITLPFTVHRVDARAPVLEELEKTDKPIDRVSVKLRYAGDERPRTRISRSPADAVFEVVQFAGEPGPSVVVHSDGPVRVKSRRALEAVRRGTPSDIVQTQKVKLTERDLFRLPPGAYEVRLVYDARKHGAKEDLVSDPLFLLVEPGKKK
jgi:hypothetical protein